MIRITKLILKAIYWKNIIKMYSYTMRIYNVKWFLLFNNSYLNFFYCLKVILLTIRFRIFIFQFLNYSRGYNFSNSYFNYPFISFFIIINDWCSNSKKNKHEWYYFDFASVTKRWIYVGQVKKKVDMLLWYA